MRTRGLLPPGLPVRRRRSSLHPCARVGPSSFSPRPPRFRGELPWRGRDRTAPGNPVWQLRRAVYPWPHGRRDDRGRGVHIRLRGLPPPGQEQAAVLRGRRDGRAHPVGPRRRLGRLQFGVSLAGGVRDGPGADRRDPAAHPLVREPERRELGGEMRRAFEVLRRGEEEKEIIIPLTGEQPKPRRGREAGLSQAPPVARPAAAAPAGGEHEHPVGVNEGRAGLPTKVGIPAGRRRVRGTRFFRRRPGKPPGAIDGDGRRFVRSVRSRIQSSPRRRLPPLAFAPADRRLAIRTGAGPGRRRNTRESRGRLRTPRGRILEELECIERTLAC